MFAPHLTPGGHLLAVPEDDAPLLAEEIRLRLGSAFALGAGHGLLHLGTAEIGRILPPAWAWWRDFAARYVTALCATPEGGEIAVVTPATKDFDALIADAPPMTGGEYLTPDVLVTLWGEIDTALHQELATEKVSLQDFLKSRHPAWNLVGRVHFNLAENRKDPESPFAFLATYTSRLSNNSSGQTKAQHLPLGQALSEYAGAANKHRLLSLLVPVQRASEACPWLKAMVDAGEIFHPLRWTPQEAVQLLRDVPHLETAGVVVRTPAAWRGSRPPRPRVTGTVGGRAPSRLGQNALLDFRMEVTLDGERLTAGEVSELLARSDGLALVRGRWIEVDREHLRSMIERFREVERTASETGLGFGEAMRLLAGADV